MGSNPDPESERTRGVGESHEGGARYDGDGRRWRVVEAAEAVPGPTTPQRRSVELCGRAWLDSREADLSRTTGSSGCAACQPVATLVLRQSRADARDRRRVVHVRHYHLHKYSNSNN